MLILALLACFAPDPHAALGAYVGQEAAARVPEGTLWVVVDTDRVTLGAVGPWEPELGVAFTGEPVAIELASASRRGMLLSPLYDALLERSEVLRDRASGAEFDGQLWVFVDRRCDDDTLRQVLFSAGQAMFTDFKLVGTGPRPAKMLAAPPAVLEPVTPWTRRHPLSPLRFAAEEGVTFRIDERPATFSIAIPQRPALQVTGADGLVAQVTAEPDDPVLFASYAAAAEQARYPVLPSFEMLLHVAKQADDRMLRAATLGREAQRQRWLEDAARAAEEAGRKQAGTWLATGAALGRGERPAAASSFLDDPVQSTPLGFYTESDALERAFLRDRWLAQPLSGAALVEQLQQQLAGDPFLTEDRGHRARWTNPPDPALHGLGDGLPAHVLVPARSHEASFFRGRQLDDPMDAFVQAIRAGQVDLSIAPDSGWYDRAQWALEPLLQPLGPKLEPDQGYTERLETAFKAAVAMRRETQVKDLALPALGAAPGSPQVVVAPALRVEPLPALYDRHAELYRWVAGLAAEEPDAVAAQVTSESARLERTFHEAAQLARADLGLTEVDVAIADVPPSRGLLDQIDVGGAMLKLGSDPEAGLAGEPQEDVSGRATERWLEQWRSDPALGGDVRVFVPAAKDGDQVVGWVVLGVRALDLVVAYREPPRVTDAAGQPVKPRLIEARHSLLVPWFTEVRTSKLWTREALRAEADRHQTARPLIEALER